METFTISDAKTQLPKLFRELTAFERLIVTVEHGTRKPSPHVHMVPDAVFQALLERASLDVACTYTDDETAPKGWWTLHEQAMGGYGDGRTPDAALESLVEAVTEHARNLAADLRAGDMPPGEALSVAVRILVTMRSGGIDAVRSLCKAALRPIATVIEPEGDREVPLHELAGRA